MNETNERIKFTLVIKDNKNKENFGFQALNDLIALGATYETSHYEKYNKHFISITLPEGYTLSEEELTTGFKKRTILDENENARGCVLVKASDLRVSNICLYHKYGVVTERNNSGELNFNHVYFGTNDEVLIEGGVVALNRRDYSTLYVESKLASLREKCIKEANELYPDWENPLAYWDEVPVISEGNVLLRKKED